MSHKKYWIRFFVAAFLIVTIIYFVYFKWSITPNEIRDFILSFGWLSPVIFWVMYSLGPFIFFPTTIFSMTAGLSYGAWPGILYIWIGLTAAAMTGYWIGQLFGKSMIKWHALSWSEPFQERIREHGFLYVLILRVFPLIGFDLLCYTSGFARVRFSHYLAATMLGVLPGATAYGLLGSSIASGDRRLIFLAVTGVLILLGMSYLFRSRVKEWLGLDHEEK
ncbi:TVP38/TMEM64 family protein [Halobacillus mangrovi]|uniref:TVP38/TMEM64 family protein n=1 Tax=Halobacillus mangrovi TaxID=402384 RepID=UPI003D95D6D3